MKKLENYFVLMAFAWMPLFYSSCGDDDEKSDGSTDKGEYKLEEDDDPFAFVEYADPQTFYDTYVSYSGTKYLIDTRSASEYAAGHLTDAINLPATIYNTDSDDAQWCKDLLATTNNSTDVCLFFYGQSSFEMAKATVGRASRIGYGKEHSRICSKDYDILKKVWK